MKLSEKELQARPAEVSGEDAQNPAVQDGGQAAEPDELDSQRVETLVRLSPEGSAASALSNLTPGLDMGKVALELQSTFIPDCTDPAERMLRSQSMVLNALFTRYAGAAGQTDDIELFELYLNAAFRAQGLCHRTIKTLLEYKYPDRKTFIKEQNNTVNAQINAGVASESREEKNVIPENKLLETGGESRLDPGKASKAGTSDPRLEAVEKLDRPKD